jgi:FKBP-type peptidyl-prolyl cis-trans isomerase
MKKLVYVLAASALVMMFTTSCKDGMKLGSKAYEPETSLDSISYAHGMQIAEYFEREGIEINAEAITAGYNEYVEENAFFTNEEKEQVLIAWQQKMQQEQFQKQQEQSRQAAQDSEPNKKLGAEFLAENKKKDGVIETASGLQYKVIRPGKGPKPSPTDIVTVHYRGKLLDGTVFDASYDRGEPIEFGLNQVIRGWSEGVQLMSKGAKYELYIPSDLAYGDQGAGDAIPGGATLIFEIELLSFKKAETPAQ